ncbi:MAG: CDGSH iron-sulfur domain-containing protein [Nitrospinae bacterium]|nr:CDGSH iron-sulfur domain-containing protein [Nitrospinota bacterium]
MPEPKVAKKGPIVMETPKGTYYWCGCGHSQKQPYCDGAHKAAGFANQPNAPLKVEVDEDGKKPWCACKNTKMPPWCDGAHTKLP